MSSWVLSLPVSSPLSSLSILFLKFFSFNWFLSYWLALVIKKMLPCLTAWILVLTLPLLCDLQCLSFLICDVSINDGLHPVGLLSGFKECMELF